jgi:hypothetical protein
MSNTQCFRWFGLVMAALCVSAPILAQKGASSPKDQLDKPRPTLIVEPVNIGPRNPALYVPYRGGDFSPASGDIVVVDVADTPSYDSVGASCNIRMTIPAPSGRDSFNGIGWDVQLTATSPSWRSEIAVLITNVNGEGYVLRPGAADTSAGTGTYTSNGVGKLCDVYGLPDLPLPDGNLYLEFYETYDDFSDCGQDGNWDSGTLSFQFGSTTSFTGWDETINGGGDAGDTPETAQSTGSGVLTAIRGTLDADDVDMYAIRITDPNLFVASLRCGAQFDTQLFLFDANGNGVVHNDDTFGLLSYLDNSTGCIPAPGVYYLAISRYNRDPVGCEGGLIWNNSPFSAIRCPDGPESTSRVAGWSGSTAAGGTYIITLQGAEGATAGNPDDCPPPPIDRWDETVSGGGDAGDLPSTAQVVSRPEATPCQTAVTRISGNRTSSTDADIYIICITDPNSFSATTVGGAGFDTQLFLFRCDGTGVVHNDDCGSLQSCIDNSTGCIQEAGIYLLAITGYNQDPVDASQQLIWNNSPFGAVRCPDGPGAANPIAGWSGTGGSGTYVIQLQGAYFVSPSGCAQCQSHNGDVVPDGCVDDADLLAVLFAFGQSGDNLGRVDVNCDRVVDDADLLIVLFNFGSGC